MYYDEIQKIENYANENYVPIIKKEAIEYIFNIFDLFLNLKIKEKQNGKTNEIKIELNILELGLAIGYSSIRFTKYILDKKEEFEEKYNIKINLNFRIYSCEKDIERFKKANANITNMEKKTKISFSKHIFRYNIEANEFLDILKNKKIFFDIAFVDANKSGYLNYYLKIKEIMKEKNILLFDNILYNGWVFGEYKEKKHRTIVKNLRKFIEYLEENDVKYNIKESADGVLEIENF